MTAITRSMHRNFYLFYRTLVSGITVNKSTIIYQERVYPRFKSRSSSTNRSNSSYFGETQFQFHRTMSSALRNKEVRLQMLPNAFQPINNTNDGLAVDLTMDKEYHEVVSSCAQCLASGGVIAVPTDTIYGVACMAQNSEATNLLYEIKQRNYKNPIAISVARIDDIYRWSKVTVPRQVLEDLLPGPVTVVFERSLELNPALNPHTHLVGIRIPGHKFMQDLAKECESPIALTSANISGASSCLRIEEFDSLWPHLDLVVNGGTLSDSNESRLGSTVVDLSVPGTYRIIRPGSAEESTSICLQEKHQLKKSTDPAKR
ncbi:hypothetical protein EGW08_011124 [Elysia chlorotica]|uniref:Threonylcarbamoyl-AMP synthase n=1 Tax=Elysia chlorotica TaxID=188477 RepID=A0A433THT5_ELYCH|nr:hypothetical protein EGW08_011124 [Elysia chlorotica]